MDEAEIPQRQVVTSSELDATTSDEEVIDTSWMSWSWQESRSGPDDHTIWGERRMTAAIKCGYFSSEILDALAVEYQRRPETTERGLGELVKFRCKLLKESKIGDRRLQD